MVEWDGDDVNEVRTRRRLLRWYPAEWRERYGEEFLALLEDSYGEDAVPLKTRLSIARSGTMERGRGAGLTGDVASSEERLRAGSHVILAGWALFVVAGATFAKSADRWRFSTPSAHRAVPSVAFQFVGWSGALGMVIVLLAAATVFPAFIRFVRGGGWPVVRRSVLVSLVVTGVACAASTSVVLWANTLNFDQRNGSLTGYQVVLTATALSVIVALVALTTCAIKVSRQLALSPATLRWLAVGALALTADMAVIFAGTVLWWTSEAMFAPTVLGNSIGNGIMFTSDVVPVTLLGVAVLMSMGLAASLFGATRVLRALSVVSI